MILDQIKKANMQAMKDKNVTARNIYGVVMNKLMLETIKRRDGGEAMTEADEIKILVKAVKELQEEQSGYVQAGKPEQAAEIGRQIDIIAIYIPKMMSEDEIKAIIVSLPDKSVPVVMKHFSANYAGKCDMKTVSIVLKSL